MKKIIPILIIGVVLLFSFSREPNYNPSDYVPILMERSVLEKSIINRPAQEVENPGKLYYKDQVIYLSEKYKGIHVINNSDPENPENIGFINIPGCVDMAIKNNSLMVDNAVDLVAIDLSNGPQSVSVTSRVKNVFPEINPPDLDYIPSVFNLTNRPEGTIIVGWELEEELN